MFVRIKLVKAIINQTTQGIDKSIKIANLKVIIMNKLTFAGLLLTTSSILIAPNLSADNHSDDSKWTLRPTFGISQMSDFTAPSTVGTQTGTADINIDGGFNAGLGLAYNINPNWSAELYWEYRSNDSETTLADGTVFTEGNYASNMFALNGIYNFQSSNQWKPYLGAGLVLIQEVDIDLESNGEEQSYSGDGETGFQVFAGVNYPITKNWEVQGEVRYGSISGIDLSGEAGAVGEFTDMDYKTTTLQLGINYRF